MNKINWYRMLYIWLLGVIFYLFLNVLTKGFESQIIIRDLVFIFGWLFVSFGIEIKMFGKKKEIDHVKMDISRHTIEILCINCKNLIGYSRIPTHRKRNLELLCKVCHN